jgi:hypothetical protein
MGFADLHKVSGNALPLLEPAADAALLTAENPARVLDR